MNATQRRRSLAAIVGSVFGVGVAYGAVTPLISLRREAAGVDSLLIGLQGAMFPLATLAIGAFVPALVSRVPLLPLLYASLAIPAGSAVLFPMFPALWAWFLLRFLMGAAGTVHWIVSEIWMNALATARDRSRLMGVYETMLAAGFTLGPLGVRVTGLEGWQPFAVVAAGIVIAGSRWGFVWYLASNACWLVFAVSTAAWGLFTMQIVFTAVSLYGVYRWFARRPLRPIDASTTVSAPSSHNGPANCGNPV